MLALLSSQDCTGNSLSLDLKTSHCFNSNIVYGSHKDIYHDVKVLKLLTKSKFPVFLVNSRVTKLNYVMKVFPHKNGQAPLYFKNETRFASLRHPNVVRNLYFNHQREVKLDNVVMDISYTIMEHARHGDFYKLIKENRDAIDDKLVRTYFRQLIEGLEYLHKNGVAHMDLKNDNLLLADDYMLKIADFDMSYYIDDTLILSCGSKYYRAPEVREGRCKIARAGDIYSAGVILFTLKTKGVFPQFEDGLVNGVNYSDLLYNDTAMFWECHKNSPKLAKISLDEDFKDLFVSMTKLNPNDRASIADIKASKWYNGSYYSNEELKSKMIKILGH